MIDERTIKQCKKYPLTYTLVIKQVKNINMRIAHNGEVIVSANPFVPMEKIDEFVSQKAAWILAHQKQMEQRQGYCEMNEHQLMLFGNSLRIKTSVAKYNHVSYDKTTLYVQHKEGADVERVIRRFLDKLCKDVFLDVAQLTHRTLKEYQLEFPQIKLRDMKSRWGTCTPAKNQITLNKRLIHYPFEFIEYVVLHEFVHFIQPNHSKAFYHVIENYMPDYKQRMELINH